MVLLIYMRWAMLIPLIFLIFLVGCTQGVKDISFKSLGTADCEDSDSNNVYALDRAQINLPGKVTVNTKEVGIVTFPDKCEDGKLYEYFCERGEWAHEIISCNCVEVTVNGETLAKCEG